MLRPSGYTADRWYTSHARARAHTLTHSRTHAHAHAFQSLELLRGIQHGNRCGKRGIRFPKLHDENERSAESSVAAVGVAKVRPEVTATAFQQVHCLPPFIHSFFFFFFFLQEQEKHKNTYRRESVNLKWRPRGRSRVSSSTMAHWLPWRSTPGTRCFGGGVGGGAFRGADPGLVKS